MSFKLIAIRPLEDCNKKYRKNLKDNQIYQFYNDYTFKFEEDDISNEVESISYIETIPKNFFDIDYVNILQESKSISINVSAVVGRNGSGKSALSELFLYALFVASNKLRFVHKSHFIYKNVLDGIRYDSDLKKIKTDFFVEFFYSHDKLLKVLRIKSNVIQIKTAELVENKYTLNGDWTVVNKRKDLFPFFYSIVTNYSFYGFNSNEIGIWIKSFFHKNDGYQMPIVINPYRNEGNININIETYLTRSRLLANVLSIEDYRDINTKSKIKSVVLFRDQRKYDKYRFLDEKNVKSRFSEAFINAFREKILKPLYEKMFSYSVGKRRRIIAEYPSIESQNENSNKVLAELYLINKLITIPSRYNSFTSYDARKNKDDDIEDNFDIEELNISDYIDDLYTDRSHVTLKVRQTLNFIKQNIFDIPEYDAEIPLKLSDMVNVMKVTREENFFTELIDYLPPPFFFSEIIFEDESNFTQLSLGEKQQVYSLNSIIYHLKNIDSVHKSTPRNRNLIKYESINLLFDEIELYFHPDFQKSYISNLLNLLKNAKYDRIKNINAIFLTHSPMILSDIPNQNILYLSEGNCLMGNSRPQKSFGANITDLLADSFFFGDESKTLIGDFAKEKIVITLNWLKIKANQLQIKSNKNPHFLIDDRIEVLRFDNIEIEQKYHKQVIDLVDEPLVKNKLKSMYLEYVVDDIVYRNEEIEKLKRQLNLLTDS